MPNGIETKNGSDIDVIKLNRAVRFDYRPASVLP